MAITTQVARVVYSVVSLGATYAIPFYFLDVDDVAVYLLPSDSNIPEKLMADSEYSISGVGVEAGGTATVFASRIKVGDQLIFCRDSQLIQPIPFSRNSQFPAKTVERNFDRVVMMEQGLDLRISRSLALPISDDEIAPMTVGQRSDRVIGFGPTGILDLSVSLDALRTIVLANPIAALSDVSDYGSITDEVTEVVDYGSII